MYEMGVKKIFDEEKIAEVVRSLAEKINRDYRDREVALVGCLTGAFVFMADLMRQLEMSASCDFIKISSYEDRMTPGDLTLELDLMRSVEGKSVIVVEDIVDTGQTLKFIKKHLDNKNPSSVDLCVLLYKESERSTMPKDEIKYLGLTVPDVFVVGYGIDYMQKYRTLPYIGYVELK